MNKRNQQLITWLAITATVLTLLAVVLQPMVEPQPPEPPVPSAPPQFEDVARENPIVRDVYDVCAYSIVASDVPEDDRVWVCQCAAQNLVYNFGYIGITDTDKFYIQTKAEGIRRNDDEFVKTQLMVAAKSNQALIPYRDQEAKNFERIVDLLFKSVEACRS